MYMISLYHLQFLKKIKVPMTYRFMIFHVRLTAGDRVTKYRKYTRNLIRGLPCTRDFNFRDLKLKYISRKTFILLNISMETGNNSMYNFGFPE